MPLSANHSPSNSTSSSSTPRHSRKSSKNLSSASDRDSKESTQPPTVNQHRRDKTKSGSSIQQQQARPRREPHQQSLSQDRQSSATQGAGTTLSQRPQLGSRAKSVPLIPNLVGTRGPVEQQNTGQGVESSEDEIAQDPFFQRYTPQGGRSPELPMSPYPPTGVNEEPHSPIRIRHHQQRNVATYGTDFSSATNPLSPGFWTGTNPSLQPLQEITIAVVGSPRVGKSTFIKNAFDLAHVPVVSYTRRKMSLDGTIYVVRLLEMSYNDLDLDDDQCICWPDMIDNQPVPVIDGAFTIYDVTSRDSLMQMPETLRGIYQAGIPYLLVASKCDYSRTLRPIDTSLVDAPLQRIIQDVRTFPTSETSPDTQKRCMAVMLRQIIAKRSGQLNQGATRRRANSSANHQAMPQLPPTLQKHHRANSEMSMQQMSRGQRQKYKPDMSIAPLSTRSKSHQQLTLQSPVNTLLEGEKHHYQDDDGDDGTDQGISMKSPRQQTQEIGSSFGELVDRLLVFQPTKADQRFASTFLALYRLFASPSQLLDNIIEKSKAVGLDNIPALSMVQQRQHHLNILEQWISYYPGDFAHSITRLKLQTFINEFGEMPIFAVASAQLATNLTFVVEDDDTDWAFCDRDGSASENDSLRIITHGIGGISTLGDGSSRHSPISPIGTSQSSLSSTHSLLSLVEHATRQAVHLMPNGKFPPTKLQWHLIMDQSEDSIARELTRMDWTMFCSIRPRDLVRHVTLNDVQKAKCRSLENVQRMIDHFNHIACWVSNFILLRDKPKHRSFMLEKMMKIARELRKMNNYNALGAFIAGINNSSVQRLAATRDLIDPAVGKDFMKLEILMSSQRSHSAYRLAWENTSGERIPYLPLHRRDLVAAAEGNKTFIDELAKRGEPKGRRINWKKFEIMGDVVVSIQKAKDAPYQSLTRNNEIKSLVIDMDIERDEDKLYDRSQQIEPSSAQGMKPRRFAWLNS